MVVPSTSPATLPIWARRIIDYAHEHHIDLAYERQAFGERDIDMTKVNDIVDHVR